VTLVSPNPLVMTIQCVVLLFLPFLGLGKMCGQAGWSVSHVMIDLPSFWVAGSSIPLGDESTRSTGTSEVKALACLH